MRSPPSLTQAHTYFQKKILTMKWVVTLKSWIKTYDVDKLESTLHKDANCIEAHHRRTGLQV